MVEQLREAAAEGRIDLSELDTRLEQALNARTYADLRSLTADCRPWRRRIRGSRWSSKAVSTVPRGPAAGTSLPR